MLKYGRLQRVRRAVTFVVVTRCPAVRDPHLIRVIRVMRVIRAWRVHGDNNRWWCLTIILRILIFISLLVLVVVEEVSSISFSLATSSPTTSKSVHVCSDASMSCASVGACASSTSGGEANVIEAAVDPLRASTTREASSKNNYR